MCAVQIGGHCRIAMDLEEEKHEKNKQLSF